jgi:hypothetical protein
MMCTDMHVCCPLEPLGCACRQCIMLSDARLHNTHKEQLQKGGAMICPTCSSEEPLKQVQLVCLHESQS